MVPLEQYIPHIAIAIIAFLLYRRDRQAFLVGGVITVIMCMSAYFLVIQTTPELIGYTVAVVGVSSMLSGYAASHFRAEKLVLDALVEKLQSD